MITLCCCTLWAEVTKCKQSKRGRWKTTFPHSAPLPFCRQQNHCSAPEEDQIRVHHLDLLFGQFILACLSSSVWEHRQPIQQSLYKIKLLVYDNRFGKILSSKVKYMSNNTDTPNLVCSFLRKRLSIIVSYWLPDK